MLTREEFYHEFASIADAELFVQRSTFSAEVLAPLTYRIALEKALTRLRPVFN